MQIKTYFWPLAIVSLLWMLILNFFGYNIPWELIGVNLLLLSTFAIVFAIQQKLIKHLFKKTIEASLTIWVIASLTFILLRVIPGGPFTLEMALSPEVRANIESKYNLDAPLYEQYWNYITGVFTFDLGQSYSFLGQSVNQILAETLPVSFELGLYALLLAYLIGIPFGVLAASHQNQWQDRWSTGLAMSGVSIPSFLVAPLLITAFVYKLEWLPPALWEGPKFYLLPILTLCVRPAAVIARLTRSSLLDVIRSDFVRTARAKGLPESRILYKHVLKNSLIPVLTFSGPLVAGILSGSFVVERLFAIPGMGQHLVNSVTDRDYPLILGATLVYAVMLVIANLVVDILYSYVDPRIRLK